VAIAAGVVVAWLSRGWSSLMALKSLGLIGAALLFFLTARAAFRAAYVNYDLATEFLVYAHSARGPKIALNTIHDLSVRTTGGLDIKVAYDNDTSYPFWWYLRNYPNATFYGAEPSGALNDDPVILAGPENWSKVDSIVRGQYQVFTYNRLWWPMQGYFGLTWDRIWGALISPGYRQALWQIWFNRDYTDYGKMTGEDFSLQNWNPSNKMRLYVRNDVAALIWSAGPSQVSIAPSQATDPYAKGMVNIDADQIIGQAGTDPGQFANPRAVAVAPDGSIYVADTMNSRIQHLAPDGSVLQVWGTFADITKGPAPGGTFNQPWGIAVAPDGTVYVADTWNHRIQHFSADGTFLDMFGTFGQGENPTAFWGPRDVLVDPNGRIFVTDTGNKRVVVFSAAEQPLTQFGGNGTELGQLDEPVGLAMGPDGTLYVADTWNQRIQAFQETTPNQFTAVRQWDVQAWFGQSLDNKPYLAASPDGAVCASDPEGFRVLCFNPDGSFNLGWGDYGTGSGQLNLPTGLAFDANCEVWVADAGNNRLMRFDPGLCAASPPS
jgi:sugar lactone lactonase YvrE